MKISEKGVCEGEVTFENAWGETGEELKIVDFACGGLTLNDTIHKGGS